jgi:hypothetical protein
MVADSVLNQETAYGPAALQLQGGISQQVRAATWLWSTMAKDSCACMTFMPLLLRARIAVERQHSLSIGAELHG